MREKLGGEVVADVRREIATTEVIKTMTFTVDRLSLLVWVWTVQSLRCARFCDPKPAYVRPPEPNVFVFLIPPLPRLQSPSASQTEAQRFVTTWSSAHLPEIHTHFLQLSADVVLRGRAEIAA